MKKYSLRYAIYCMLFTEIIFAVTLCLMAGFADFSELIRIIFSYYSFVIQVSLLLSSRLAFRLLYKKRALSKPWVVGVLNFLLLFIFAVCVFILCGLLTGEDNIDGWDIYASLACLLFISWLLIPAYIFFAIRLSNKFNLKEGNLQ